MPRVDTYVGVLFGRELKGAMLAPIRVRGGLLPTTSHSIFYSRLGLGTGLEENFVFDSKSENRDRAVEAVESVSEASAY